MLPLLFLPAARDDVAKVHLWYESVKPGLRFEFDRCLDATLDQIERHPRMYAVIEAHYRKARLARFPYQVFYRIGPTSLLILEVSHEHAHPEAALGRVAARDAAG